MTVYIQHLYIHTYTHIHLTEFMCTADKKPAMYGISCQIGLIGQPEQEREHSQLFHGRVSRGNTNVHKLF